MPDMLISALVQAPFVLAMAYLVQRFLAHLDARDEEWRGFMDRADDLLAERLTGLTKAVEHLTEVVVQHDAAVRSALRHMEAHPRAYPQRGSAQRRG